MISRPVVLGLVAAACMAAAGAGAFVAVRQNAVDRSTAAVMNPPSSQAAGTAQPASAKPVAETEAVVAPSTTDGAKPAEAPSTEPTKPIIVEDRPATKSDARGKRATADKPVASRPQPSRTAAHTPDPPVYRSTPPDPAPSREAQPPSTPVTETPQAEAGRAPEVVPAIPELRFIEVVVPASSVIGLQMASSVSSETARVEDRVEARVTRDVMADGRTAIPAGSRMLGSVTMVERGGKIKEQAKLGVRFHTLVLANGTEVPLRTDVIVREGESPSGDSARKIGGAAAGGAILGAILGGGKGAAIGGATGAAGGTAVVMAGDRNAAKLTTGTIVTVKLNAPVTLEVERN